MLVDRCLPKFYRKTEILICQNTEVCLVENKINTTARETTGESVRGCVLFLNRYYKNEHVRFNLFPLTGCC